MKNQIDNLVAAIRETRARPLPSEPTLAAVLRCAGLDGPGLSSQQWEVLERWSSDITLSPAEREYASLQLKVLNEERVIPAG